jgi:CheY-like chemotaxis protein
MGKSTVGRTALVVDDSMLIRHTVCRFLEERGFHLETATNGVEALRLLETIIPDIIITDLSMPMMTGSELITEIKNRPAFDSTPIVVLSAKLKADTKPEEVRANFVVYKDIDIEQQLDIVLIKVFSK